MGGDKEVVTREWRHFVSRGGGGGVLVVVVVFEVSEKSVVCNVGTFGCGGLVVWGA